MSDDSQGPKDELLQVRIDADLLAEVQKKAERFGGASAVVRALLRRWVEEDIVTAEQVLAEVGRKGQVARRPMGQRAPRAEDK
jgi:Arc/MetJ family transcription regulator